MMIQDRNLVSEVDVSLADDGSSPIWFGNFGQTCQELFRDVNGDFYVTYQGYPDVARWTEYEMSILFSSQQSKTNSWKETETLLMKAIGLE